MVLALALLSLLSRPYERVKGTASLALFVDDEANRVARGGDFRARWAP